MGGRVISWALEDHVHVRPHLFHDQNCLAACLQWNLPVPARMNCNDPEIGTLRNDELKHTATDLPQRSGVAGSNAVSGGPCLPPRVAPLGLKGAAVLPPTRPSRCGAKVKW